MKTTVITILTLLTLISCNGQEKQSNRDKKTELHYEEISESSISFGGHNSILDYKSTADKNYLLYLRTNQQDNIHKDDFYFLKISPKGDSIGSMPVSFENFLTDYIELDQFYYVVTTDLRTMGGYTKDFLNKYDKNWKLIWSRKIDKPKYPDGSTVLTLTRNNEILLIANEFLPKTTKIGISFRRYNLDGKLISENLMLTKGHSNPISIIQSADNNHYLTAEQYDQEANINSLWLMKLTQKGDTIWTKKYPHFYSRQTILTTSGDLLFYGSNYSPTEEQKTHYHYLKIIKLDKEGNLIWQKDIKQNYYEEPGNIIETKSGSYLFSSTITPIKDKGDRAYVFELDPNGNLTFSRKFDYSVGISSVPFLIRTEGQITMIGQKWIGKFGDPFHDIIHITKLTE
jgi:hypothetical protein